MEEELILFQFGLKTNILNIGDKTQIEGEMNDLTIFRSTFSKIRDSKIKHRVTLIMPMMVFLQLFDFVDFTSNKSVS